MFLLYNLLLTLLSPLWAPWMWLRARRRKEQPNWSERFGSYPLTRRQDGSRIWFHAVSVGEVMAALPILREFRALRPDCEIVLSTTTSSGHRTAIEQAVGLYDQLVYFPIDVARFQLAAMQHVQPDAIAIMETELWMNFLWAAKVFDAQTFLINGRISDRSFPRSMKLRFFYRPMLKNVDRCLMQTDRDKERILALGAGGAEVFGNSKYDQAVEGLDADPAKWRKTLGIPDGKAVIVVGSTRGELEEEFVLHALVSLRPGSFVVIHAPRHIERTEALEARAQKAFANVGLRSKGETADYLILDTYGELTQVYSIADIVIVGGGFDRLGGQNLIQPLAHGKPVLHGPHMNNFRDIAEAAAAAGASIVCRTPIELTDALESLLADPARRAEMGKAAVGLVQANLGASKRYAQAVADCIIG